MYRKQNDISMAINICTGLCQQSAYHPLPIYVYK